MKSLAESLTPDEQRAFFEGLSPAAAYRCLYDWSFWARPNQLPPPGDWVVWLLMAGRGFGKSRTGAEWVREEAESGRRKRIALVARTTGDVRDVMVEGESGILAISPKWCRPKYEPSKRRLTWPNGTIATTYSADEPDLLRGPQHDGAWVDELASWTRPDTWDQLMFGLRMGDHPQVVVTTTPRPTKIIRALAASATTHVTRGSTFDNRTNLAGVFFEKIIEKYEGTRLGRQEISGEILDDNPNALWQRKQIDDTRVDVPPSLSRIVIGVDPAVTSKADSDSTGIVVVGMDNRSPAHFYILADGSGIYTPDQWARMVVILYNKYEADRVVAEVNQGGDMVESILRQVDPDVSYVAVHATRGKIIRAEPIAALYEQGRGHHVGSFPQLEDEMCEFDALTDQKSPDRMDALVWALTHLTEKATSGFLQMSDEWRRSRA